VSSTIAVDQLRVGMYIHLDGGWLSHPFPLSAFRISSSDEIQTLRRLGLQQVRWVPERSLLEGSAGAEAGGAAPRAATAASAAPVAPSADELAARQRQAWLAEQRAAAQRCERQYGEAARAWREAWDASSARPQDAAATTQALTRAMLDKMLAADEVGIRLVGGGGDRMAAHALNVAVISLLIGRTMGMADSDMLELGVGALLHDVGKQDLPDRLRHAEEGFNSSELNVYRDHVAKGVLQGKRMALPAGALAVLAQHHEHADGTGFPLRITADRMTLAARIVAIVNRYDNLCNPPSRAMALTPHEAVAMLFAQGRARFDAPVLNAFIRMMGVYPAGSLVQLTDDRYAMVVGVNSSRPLKPRVLVHGQARGAISASRTAANEAQLLDLEEQPDLGIRRSLAAAKLPPAVLAALDPRPRVSYYFEPLTHDVPAAELAA
jgi:HD-GYP domain-containing protein (c-di-GMP phosphodiesterase class II)